MENKFFCLLFILVYFLPFASSISASVYIPEKYDLVSSGERIYFEVEIKYPENYIRKDLVFNYTVLYEGNVVAQSKVLKAVETQISFIDYLIVPSYSESGLYELDVEISDNADLYTSVSTTFNVRSDNEFLIYFWILVGIFLFVGLLIILTIILVGRKR